MSQKWINSQATNNELNENLGKIGEYSKKHSAPMQKEKKKKPIKKHTIKQIQLRNSWKLSNQNLVLLTGKYKEII